jgi:hypothetical protein
VSAFNNFLKLCQRILERRKRGIKRNQQFFKTINTGVLHLRIAAAGVLLLGAAALAAIVVNPNPPKLPWAVPTAAVGINPIGVDIDLATNTIYVANISGPVKAVQQEAAKAVPLLESAIARDPKFTLAYCVLADAHLNILELIRSDKARVEKTKEAIDAALRISPNSAEAHLRKARYFFRSPMMLMPRKKSWRSRQPVCQGASMFTTCALTLNGARRDGRKL